MVSHQEKCSYKITEIKSENSFGSGEQEDFIEQQQFHEKCSKGKAVEEFECVTVKDVLAPVPLSCIPLETGLGFEQQAEAGHGTESPSDGTENFVQQPASTNGQSSKRKHTSEGNDEEICFRLFKFQNGSEQYILEAHEDKFGDVNSYHIMLENEGGEKWSVGIYHLDEEIWHDVDIMEEDPNPPIFHRKYNLPLLERLDGWTLENRKRKNGVIDKLYYHRKRQFRSMVEVVGFLLYSSKPKDLKPLTTIINLPQPLEEEAANTLTMLSNVEAFDTRAQRSDNGSLRIEEDKHDHFEYPEEEYTVDSLLSLIDPPNESEGARDISHGNKNEDLDTQEKPCELFKAYFLHEIWKGDGMF